MECFPPPRGILIIQIFILSIAMLVPNKISEIVATSNYSISINAVVNKNNIWGTQFHPEKVQSRIENYGKLCKLK